MDREFNFTTLAAGLAGVINVEDARGTGRHIQLEIIPVGVEQRGIGRYAVAEPVGLESRLVGPARFLGKCRMAGNRKGVKATGFVSLGRLDVGKGILSHMVPQ